MGSSGDFSCTFTATLPPLPTCCHLAWILGGGRAAFNCYVYIGGALSCYLLVSSTSYLLLVAASAILHS